MGQKYRIEWCTGVKSEQEEGHLFGAFFRRDPSELYGHAVVVDVKTEMCHLGRVEEFCSDHKRMIVKPITLGMKGQQLQTK